MKETYSGAIDIEFEMPPVRLRTIRPDESLSWRYRISLATRRRYFTLSEDWIVKLGNVSYLPDANGLIRIPSTDKQGNKIRFDGASVPLPWLISFMTIGILRPLGVMLIASIIHDYMFKYGELLRDDDQPVPVQRHVADRLFRDIISTVNRLPLVAWIAWFAVRIGWLVVEFNGRRRSGRKPVVEYLFVAALLSGFILLFICHTSAMVIGCVSTYLLTWLFSLWHLGQIE